MTLPKANGRAPSTPALHTSSLVAALLRAIEDLVMARSRQFIAQLVTAGGDSGQPSMGTFVRKRPKQLCPVPGCRKVAAPVFGMVCREHKDLPKTTVAKYRAERRGDFSHLA